ncbi:MAG: DUF429 domain-containing protein [Planctomycetota bacterium]
MTLIDVPIGLLEGARVAGVQRGCDAEARRLLGRRSSSVFTPPCREALGAKDYDKACAVNRAVLGRAMSLQAWHIVPKVAEVDAWLQPGGRTDGKRAGALAESHPELVFAELSGEPMATKKRSADGRAERAGLLDRLAVGGDVLGALAAWRGIEGVGRGAVADDDALDAAVLAWVASRPAREIADLPSSAEVDRRGLPMRMVVPRPTLRVSG